MKNKESLHCNCLFAPTKLVFIGETPSGVVTAKNKFTSAETKTLDAAKLKLNPNERKLLKRYLKYVYLDYRLARERYNKLSKRIFVPKPDVPKPSKRFKPNELRQIKTARGKLSAKEIEVMKKAMYLKALKENKIEYQEYIF
jgi:hypothetical protein